MSTIKIINNLKPEEVKNIITILEQDVRQFLRPDISNYAKGRMRTWLNIGRIRKTFYQQLFSYANRTARWKKSRQEKIYLSISPNDSA